MAHQLTRTQSTKDALLNAGIFTKSDVTALSARLNEPDWLAQQRQTAWTVFEETPMPSRSDEDWRRTSLQKIKWNKMQPAGPSSVAPTQNLADLPADVRSAVEEGHAAAGRIVIANGRVVYFELDPELAQQGVIFAELSTAAREHPQLVQPYLAAEAVPPSNGKFAALNAALWQGGVFLYLPKGVAVDQHKPFQTAFILEGEGSVIVPRTLIVAEESSEATYIEESISHGAHNIAMNVGVVEIYAQANSQIRYVDVQNWGEDVYNFNVKRSIGQADSNVIWETGQLGGRLTKTYFDSVLAGNGSNTELNGVYFLEGKQHLDLDSLLHHIGVATGGDLLLHGAVKDKSRSVFTGLIKIDPTGQQTNSYLKNENLMLDETARTDSIPSLEIEANDVRASHGATIGQIDEEYIFYLQSRGIPRNTAVRMVVEGFFYKVFDRMYNERVREKLFSAVTAKIGD
ncbi:MAG: Fe-S cluster assembly protein SufD [Chloroflexi bacterium]|nr:MAG: Fe-S cluster assembly protein SufD [Chloroflexota bacterium]